MTYKLIKTTTIILYLIGRKLDTVKIYASDFASNTVELKMLIDDVKKEIIAFLNIELGGTIYVGVSDSGEEVKLGNNLLDEYESTIINWIRDEAIMPNCSDFDN